MSLNCNGNDEMATISLNSADESRDLLITQVTGADQKVLRLREMGFLEGRRVRVLQASDPMLCQVDRSRIGLDRGLADGVFVRPL